MNITLEIFKKIDGKYNCINVITGERVIEHTLSTLYEAKIFKYKWYKRITDEYDYKTSTHTLTVYIQYPLSPDKEYKYIYRGIRI